jgi:hypothetical protein
MPPKAAAEKKPASKAPASKAPAEKKEAGKKTAATGEKKKRTKTRKETYSSYIYKGMAPLLYLSRVVLMPWRVHNIATPNRIDFNFNHRL